MRALLRPAVASAVASSVALSPLVRKISSFAATPVYGRLAAWRLDRTQKNTGHAPGVVVELACVLRYLQGTMPQSAAGPTSKQIPP